MKSFVFLLAFLFALSSWAGNAELPENYCQAPYYECSQHQKDLVKLFNAVGKVRKVPPQAGVYAGSCFMVSPYYYPEQEQFGFIYINKVGGNYNFNSQFAFYYESDPYKNLTLAEAQAEYPKVSPHFMNVTKKQWFVSINEDVGWYYYAREVAKNRLVFIGLWGREESLVCDFKMKEEK